MVGHVTRTDGDVLVQPSLKVASKAMDHDSDGRLKVQANVPVITKRSHRHITIVRPAFTKQHTQSAGQSKTTSAPSVVNGGVPVGVHECETRLCLGDLHVLVQSYNIGRLETLQISVSLAEPPMREELSEHACKQSTIAHTHHAHNLQEASYTQQHC